MAQNRYRSRDEAIDMITGTVWAGSGPSQLDTVSSSVLRQSTVDAGAAVTTDGPVATVVFDTSGFSGVNVPFRLSGVAELFGGFDSKFFKSEEGGPTTMAPNGVLRISAVPASSCVWVLALAAPLVMRKQRTKLLKGRASGKDAHDEATCPSS